MWTNFIYAFSQIFHEHLLCTIDTAAGAKYIAVNKDSVFVEFNKSEYISKFKNGKKINNNK